MKNFLKLFHSKTQPSSVEKTFRNNVKNIPLQELPGIGRHTPKALASYGILTVNQFAKFEESEILALLGKSGLKLLGTAKTLCLN